MDADISGLVRLEVEELVAGSFLEGAPVVAVSSMTGAGIDELRERTGRVARAVPRRDRGGYFRLPIDRVFSVKGFGTVVTGTLISGSVHKEQEVEFYPGGRRLRVRGVQVYGVADRRAVAGQRTALNLAGHRALRAGARRGVGCARHLPRRELRLLAGTAAFRQAAEASRARTFSFRHG